MKSNITKIAAAAVVITGIVFFLTLPTSIVLADVVEKVRQFDCLIQKEHRIITAIGQKQPILVTDVKKYIQANRGYVEEQYDQRGNLVTTVYLLKDKQQIITVLHQPKQYFIIDLKDTSMELPDSFNAQGLVEWIVLEQNPHKLGQEEIDGHKVEGFEVVNPKAMKDLSKLSKGLYPVGDNTWRLWVDVKSKLPVKVEGEFVMGKGPITNYMEVQTKFETTGIEWGAQFDRNILEPKIPADFTLIPFSTSTK